MPSSGILLYAIGLLSLVAIFTLSVILAVKLDRIQQLRDHIHHLQQSLNEMDEQAKLIVRTDMELNKTQEELDKKIHALYALQHLSRSLSTTLEEAQIFQRVDASYLEHLGFEKSYCLLVNEREQTLSVLLANGFSQEELDTIRSFIYLNRNFIGDVIRAAKVASSLSLKTNAALVQSFQKSFGVHSFIIAPVLPNEGVRGILWAGTNNPDFSMTAGDEELLSILANQIGQALENARLFEKTWRAQQDLEKKVDERTQALSKALEEVKIISKRKTDFISAVSHELRTPLTSIKGYASILLAGKLGQVPEEVRLRLEKINRHSDELTGIVNELLDIARIESGKITMRKEPIELSRTIASVADLLGVQLKDKKIEFRTVISPQATTVLADAVQLNRVFINLIGNALKFTPAGGMITVHTSPAPPGLIRVDITDTGCGIPPEAKEAVFEEFYRVENAINETVKGTGLGLSLVKHIIEAHQGKIWVESQLNRGATFSFTLPQPH